MTLLVVSWFLDSLGVLVSRYNFPSQQKTFTTPRSSVESNYLDIIDRWARQWRLACVRVLVIVTHPLTDNKGLAVFTQRVPFDDGPKGWVIVKRA